MFTTKENGKDIQSFLNCVCTPEHFIQLRVVHMGPLAICQLQFRFSYSNSGSLGGFSSWVSAPIHHDSVCACLFLQLGGQQFAAPLLQIQEGLLIFQSFQLFICKATVATFKLLTCRPRNHLHHLKNSFHLFIFLHNTGLHWHIRHVAFKKNIFPLLSKYESSMKADILTFINTTISIIPINSN